ncbi:MAG: hypothetical protein BZ151_09635 [Desulfobacca sp. 4484_104]|nr:MAG: hypothetical protein BZ151_09635 [Desulfobacca sp. 4484_104]
MEEGLIGWLHLIILDMDDLKDLWYEIFQIPRKPGRPVIKKVASRPQLGYLTKEIMHKEEGSFKIKGNPLSI